MINQANKLSSVICDIESYRLEAKEDIKNRYVESEDQRKNKY